MGIEDGLLKNLITSGIVKGPGIMDMVKLIQHKFIRKPNESYRQYALRFSLEMIDIVCERKTLEWVADPHSFRLYVVELWALLFEIEKKENSDPDVKRSYQEAFEKMKYCNTRINIIPLKLYVMNTNKDEYVKIISEYFLMWYFGIFQLLSYGYSGILFKYSSSVIELDNSDRHRMSADFKDKLDELREGVSDVLKIIFPDEGGE